MHMFAKSLFALILLLSCSSQVQSGSNVSDRQERCLNSPEFSLWKPESECNIKNCDGCENPDRTSRDFQNDCDADAIVEDCTYGLSLLTHIAEKHMYGYTGTCGLGDVCRLQHEAKRCLSTFRECTQNKLYISFYSLLETIEAMIGKTACKKLCEGYGALQSNLTCRAVKKSEYPSETGNECDSDKMVRSCTWRMEDMANLFKPGKTRYPNMCKLQMVCKLRRKSIFCFRTEFGSTCKGNIIYESFIGLLTAIEMFVGDDCYKKGKTCGSYDLERIKKCKKEEEDEHL